MAVIIDNGKCTGCGDCVEVCPVDALKLVDEKSVCDAEECTDCLACIDECPEEAISEGD